MKRIAVAGLAVALAVPALAVLMAASGGSVAVADSAPTVALSGHGFGHGRGMGQYGALGYALTGWSYHQILDHYYGGTTAGQAPSGSVMTVRMTSRDGLPTVVAQEKGELSVSGVSCASASPCAVQIVRAGPGKFTIMQGTACNGGPAGWKTVAASVSGASVPVVATVANATDRTDMLQLCEAAGVRWLRGDIWAVDTGTGQATVNHVALDSYVRGVVPRESPASWGTLGAGQGEQALMAQAVAARSYAMAENRWPYAKTCDTTDCQVYGGRAFEDNLGNYTDLEGTATYATSDAAVSQTAGELRRFGDGSTARTEFSSSTGGYTTGGAFPAVIDDGDATPSNPNHDWTDSATSASIQAAFGGGLGPLLSVEVTGRNGLGDMGGRVTTMVLHFAGGNANTTGDAFAGALGLRSDWFTVTAQPSNTGGQVEADPYHVLTANGTVYPFNGAAGYGSLAGTGKAVSLGETPGGYLILTSDGAVHPFGSATGVGGLTGKALNAPPFEIAPTPTGRGYWIVAFDGGVFSYGDAVFHGSTGAIRLNQPVVGMAPTPDGGGYWLVAADGGIFAYGDAAFFGSTGAMRLNKPVVAMTPTASGHGYWLIASDGGVFSFGDARYAGSLPGLGIQQTAVAIATRPGTGYVVATAPGHVYGFGLPGDSTGPADLGATSPTVAVGFPK